MPRLYSAQVGSIKEEGGAKHVTTKGGDTTAYDEAPHTLTPSHPHTLTPSPQPQAPALTRSPQPQAPALTPSPQPQPQP